MYYTKCYLVVKYDEYKNPSTTYDESDFGVCFFKQTMKKVDNVYQYYYDESGDVFDIVSSGTYGYLTYNQNQKMYYIDGKIVIKNVQTDAVLYILDESYGICYLADGITKYGVLLSYNFDGSRENPLRVSNIQYLVGKNYITFSGKNIDDYLDNTHRFRRHQEQ